MHATEHNNQERLNPQRVRNSIIGFVLSPKALSSILVNRLKHQVLAAQTKRAPATLSFEVSQNLQLSAVYFCTGRHPSCLIIEADWNEDRSPSY
jgi:hypothetical protein